MIIPVNPGTNNSSAVIYQQPGAARLLLQNPVGATATLYFHQGYSIRCGTAPIATPGASTGSTTLNETGAATASLAPGESIILGNETTYVHTGAANVSATVNAAFFGYIR